MRFLAFVHGRLCSHGRASNLIRSLARSLARAGHQEKEKPWGSNANPVKQRGENDGKKSDTIKGVKVDTIERETTTLHAWFIFTVNRPSLPPRHPWVPQPAISDPLSFLFVHRSAAKRKIPSRWLKNSTRKPFCSGSSLRLTNVVAEKGEREREREREKDRGLTGSPLCIELPRFSCCRKETSWLLLGVIISPRAPLRYKKFLQHDRPAKFLYLYDETFCFEKKRSCCKWLASL